MATNTNTYKGIYAMHKYWGKKPFNEISRFIEKNTAEGDVVLDSFCGSGVTLIEALKLNRKCVGVDINPIAILLSKVSLTTVNPTDVKAYFNRIQKKLKDKINSLYEIEINGLKTLTTHTIWKDNKPIEVWYSTEATQKKIRSGSTEDIRMAASPTLKPKWYPKSVLFENSRINVSKGETVAELFTPRALVGLSYLLEEIENIEDVKIRNIFKLTLSGTLSQASNLVFVIRNRKNKTVSEEKSCAEVGSWVIGYWIPKEHFEINVWHCFENRFKRIMRGISEVNDLFSHKSINYFSESVRLINGSATKLPFDNDSVDYVFIDPPHANRILYMEQSLMWNSWLRLDGKIDWENEIIVSEAKERKNKNLENYITLLDSAFSEIKRVLKKGKIFSIAFNCLNNDAWMDILRLFTKHGFSIIGIEPMEYSATSVVQDSRKNALKTDFVFSFKNTKDDNLEEITFLNDDNFLEEKIKSLMDINPQYELYNVMNALFEQTVPLGYVFNVSHIVKKCAEII